MIETCQNICYTAGIPYYCKRVKGHDGFCSNGKFIWENGCYTQKANQLRMIGSIKI